MTIESMPTNHDEIAELIPDYILGTLPDDEARRVAEHLEGCAVCRAEYDDALVTSSLLFDAGLVDPAIREALVARLSPDVATPVWPVASDPLGGRPVDEPAPSGGPDPRPTPIFSRATRVALAIAAAVILAVGGWAVVDRLGDDGGDDRVAQLTGNPAFAHPLTDTESGSSAAGVIYVDPAEAIAYVTATGLVALPEGRGYQVWLFTERGQQVSGGFLSVDADGNAEALVTTPASFGSYVAVGLSPEPLSGSASPTGPLALGGWIR